MKNFIELFILENGFPASIVKKTYITAYKESKQLAKENDLNFIKETMEILLEINNNNCAYRFLESNFLNFNEFINSLFDEDTIITKEELLSTNFTPDQKPQNGGEKNNHKFKVSMLGFDNSDEEENKEALV